MDIREIIARLKNLEEQFINLSTKQGNSVDASEKKDDSNAEKINEVKNNSKETTASLEETAITVADFLAEYYLSQLGIDDFDMEGGEEE